MSKTEIPDQEKEKEKEKLTFVLEGSLKVIQGKEKKMTLSNHKEILEHSLCGIRGNHLFAKHSEIIQICNEIIVFPPS